MAAAAIELLRQGGVGLVLSVLVCSWNTGSVNRLSSGLHSSAMHMHMRRLVMLSLLFVVMPILRHHRAGDYHHVVLGISMLGFVLCLRDRVWLMCSAWAHAMAVKSFSALGYEQLIKSRGMTQVCYTHFNLPTRQAAACKRQPWATCPSIRRTCRHCATIPGWDGAQQWRHSGICDQHHKPSIISRAPSAIDVRPV